MSPLSASEGLVSIAADLYTYIIIINSIIDIFHLLWIIVNKNHSHDELYLSCISYFSLTWDIYFVVGLKIK